MSFTVFFDQFNALIKF